MLFFIFLQPLRLRNLQSQIQSRMSFQLKLKICALRFTSFCLWCVKILLAGMQQGEATIAELVFVAQAQKLTSLLLSI